MSSKINTNDEYVRRQRDRLIKSSLFLEWSYYIIIFVNALWIVKNVYNLTQEYEKKIFFLTLALIAIWGVSIFLLLGYRKYRCEPFEHYPAIGLWGMTVLFSFVIIFIFFMIAFFEKNPFMGLGSIYGLVVCGLGFYCLALETRVKYPYKSHREKFRWFKKNAPTSSRRDAS